MTKFRGLDQANIRRSPPSQPSRSQSVREDIENRPALPPRPAVLRRRPAKLANGPSSFVYDRLAGTIESFVFDRRAGTIEVAGALSQGFVGLDGGKTMKPSPSLRESSEPSAESPQSWSGPEVRAASPAQPEKQQRPLVAIIETDIGARLDCLPWSRFHTLVLLAIGITWILDGLEVKLTGTLSGNMK